MKRTSIAAPGNRADPIRIAASHRRLHSLLILAIAGCTVALIIRTVSKRNASPQPRYLAENVILSSPPPLAQPDDAVVHNKTRRLETLRAAMSADPRNAAASVQFAQAALDVGDLLEARESLRSAVRVEPRPDADILADLGEADQRLGLCGEALQTYRSLVDRFPADIRGYLGESQVQDLSSHRSEAVHTLDTALQKLPREDVSGQLRIVGQFEAFGDLARALKEAERILSGRPENSDAILTMVHLLIKAERPGDALPLLNRLLAREPGNARARYELGVVLESPLTVKRDALLAEDALLTAIETSPNETPAYRRLAEMYEQQGRYRQCAYVSLQLLGKTPDSAEARLHLAYAYAHLGDARGSAEQRRLAVALLDRDREYARLNTLIRQRPQDAGLRLELGRHSMKTGRTLEALAAFQAAAVLAPGDAGARRDLNALCTQLSLPAPAAGLAR